MVAQKKWVFLRTKRGKVTMKGSDERENSNCATQVERRRRTAILVDMFTINR